MRVIMIKTLKGNLVSAKAVFLEGGFVHVCDPIDIGDGPSAHVPKELCYAYDPDLQSQVNSLLLVAESLAFEKRLAATQLLEAGGELADLGQEEPMVQH